MSEKRFTETERNCYHTSLVLDNQTQEELGTPKVVDLLNEQQATIKELEKNFDDLVEWASEIANRNVVLDEQIGRLQQEIRLLKPTNIEQYEQIVQLQEENEQLKKQIQIYEQLISNSYVGEEETLDGFVGKYVIWEDELQKYKEKIKNVIDDELNDCCKIMNEQQDTIRKLQDLCGESDSENAKLRIENKRLEKEVNLLKPTNIEQYEQIQKLRKELDDCEKFRYIVFKRLNDEYIKECSIK